MSTASDLSAIESKLDLLISLLRIAYREPIEAAREELLSDRVKKEILIAARRDWIDAGALKKVAVAKSKASKPTVERRIAELLELGALERTGAGGHVNYRATALFDL
jgi:Fic family protein